MRKSWIAPSALAFVIVVSVFFYAGSCQPAHAQDNLQQAAEAHWAYKVVGSDPAVTVFVWLLNLGGAAVLAWLGRKEWKNEKTEYCVKFLSAGIRNTYVSYVNGIKAGHADGKLTEEEKAKARQMAIDYAVGLAKNQGLDLVKVLGKDYIPVIMEWIIGVMRKRDVPLV